MKIVISPCIIKKKLSKLVSFCVAILISKMEEKSNIFGILCFIISREVKMQLKKNKKVCAVYGEGAVTDGKGQKWFVKFHAGDFSLEDALWSGRPTEEDSDQMEMAPQSSTLAWKIPWMEEPGRLQSMRLLRVGHD